MKPQNLISLLLSLAVLAPTAGCLSNSSSQNAATPNLHEADLFQRHSFKDFGLENSKKIALTFDDGPTPQVTSALLEVLRRYQVKATFFILAKNVAPERRTLQRMRQDGHIIGNHSYSHDALSKQLYLDHPEELFHQVVDSHRVIRPVMNPSHRMYFRAPYGAWKADHAAKLNGLEEVRDYIGPVFWNIGGVLTSNSGIARPTSAQNIGVSADWDCWTNKPSKGILPLSPATCAQGYLNDINAKKGGVVLMHDVDMRTVEMVEILLPKLIQEGYEFITLDDIREMDKYEHTVN